MKKLAIYLFAIIISPFRCSADKLTQKATQQSQQTKGFNKELLIDIESDTIAAYALIADGKSRKETVILIKGYPGNDNNFDLAHELRNNGFNVLVFDHRGAWRSQGTYLYSNCLKDIEYVIDFLIQPQISEDLHIDIDSFILIGRSLGGGVALISGSQISNVKKIVGISNVNYGELMEGYSDISELKNYSKYMQKQIMMNHDINEFLTELLDFKKEYNIINYSEQLSEKDILIIEDSHKNDSWINQLKNPAIRYLDSDHNFVSEREEMISEIINWVK